MVNRKHMKRDFESECAFMEISWFIRCVTVHSRVLYLSGDILWSLMYAMQKINPNPEGEREEWKKKINKYTQSDLMDTRHINYKRAARLCLTSANTINVLARNFAMWNVSVQETLVMQSIWTAHAIHFWNTHHVDNIISHVHHHSLTESNQFD